MTGDRGATVAEAPSAPPSRRWLRAAVAVAAALFVALLAYGVFADAPEGTIDESLAAGEPAPAPGFELTVLESGEPGPALAGVMRRSAADGTVSLGELRGSPVVVNFWASWCDPCRVEAPVLERGWLRGRQRGVAFLGLNMQDLTGDARDFIAEFDTTYLNVRDETNAVAREWGVTGLPETFFVSAGGEVVAHVIGAVSSRQLAEGVEAAERGVPLGSISGGDRRSVE